MSSNSLPGAPRRVGRQGRTPGMCASVRGGAERCRLDVLGDDEDARLFTGPRSNAIPVASPSIRKGIGVVAAVASCHKRAPDLHHPVTRRVKSGTFLTMRHKQISLDQPLQVLRSGGLSDLGRDGGI